MRTECPLFPEAYYSYSIDLSGNTYTLTFRYSSRSQQYMLSVEDAEENILIRNIALVPFYPLTQQYSLEEPIGDFILLPIENVGLVASSIPNPRELHKTHWLLYDDFQN